MGIKGKKKKKNFNCVFVTHLYNNPHMLQTLEWQGIQESMHQCGTL
jgi:hypothetical protein